MTASEYERWHNVQKNGHTNMNVKGNLSTRRGLEMLYYKYHKDNGIKLRTRYRP